jgi:orotidine-5'-phosphate decarboxylase
MLCWLVDRPLRGRFQNSERELKFPRLAKALWFWIIRLNHMSTHLSTKPIPPAERLIFALDVQSVDEAKALVLQLGDAVRFYKIGLELFMAGGYFELLDWLALQGKKIFVDLKFFDVPETVKRAVAALKGRPVEFCTVHGNQGIMEAAVSAGSGVKILGVTVLTSLDQGDLADLGFACDTAELVLSRAKRALEAGCAGVISSGLEAARLRESLGDRLLIISPGIRPVENRPADDQKRIVTPSAAFQAGADYIVVGRPIRNAADPRAAAQAIQAEIASVFAV